MLSETRHYDRRTLGRITARKEARFFHGNMFYSGILLNLSEEGFFLNTTIALPVDSIFGLMICQGNDIITVISKVKWMKSRDHSFSGMGAAILNPSQDYLGYIHILKTG